MTDDVEHSSIRFARASRAIRSLSLPECIELLQLVEREGSTDWARFEKLLIGHGVDSNQEGDRHALRISLLIRRMELEKKQIEEAKKRYPGAPNEKKFPDDIA